MIGRGTPHLELVSMSRYPLPVAGVSAPVLTSLFGGFHSAFLIFGREFAFGFTKNGFRGSYELCRPGADADKERAYSTWSGVHHIGENFEDVLSRMAKEGGYS